MIDAIAKTPTPRNEPTLSYAPNSKERAELKAALQQMSGETIDIPMYIGGEDVRTGVLSDVRSPHRRDLLLARAHEGGAEHTHAAIAAAKRAHGEWASMPWSARASVFLRAAELLSTRYRPILNAATMLGQSKTAFQAEIDSACELIDFFRFNVHYARMLCAEQPDSAPGMWNMMEPRPLEGFVFAPTPFNFTAIAGNLPTSPALMGNTVIWKPAASAMYSAHFIVQLLREAGLPPGVINMVHGPSEWISNACLDHEDLAGIHFTGSTPVFQMMWKRVGDNIHKYKCYPRVVGETGGKDFVFAHASADLEALTVALVRGAFEYQGQKCSAASRAYIPRSIWPSLKERVVEMVKTIRMGDVADFRNFMGAVIDARAYARLSSRIEAAKEDGGCTLLTGGGHRDTDGFFIEPTVIQVSDPQHALMRDELFGPVLSLWVYEDSALEEALSHCNSSEYALTGAIFANDRRFIEHAGRVLRFAAGNFYINDKPTGAVVGQQPFGGGRASGTNDKAGSVLNLMRWVSPRTVKENLAPPRAYTYPFMAEE